MNKETIEDAANEYADKHGFRVPYDSRNKFYDDNDVKWSKEGFIAGAESDAAKEYWYAQWQASKHVEPVEKADRFNQTVEDPRTYAFKLAALDSPENAKAVDRIINRQSAPISKPVEPSMGLTKEVIKEVASATWLSCSNAYRLYPDSKHTFASFWSTFGENLCKNILPNQSTDQK